MVARRSSEARVDALPERGRQLLRLEQHVLAHRDLPEVVHQRGEAQLAHLCGGEANVAVRAVIGAVDGLGEAGRERGDPQRVARRGRVAKLDRADGRLDEALEGPLDLRIQLRVLDRDAA
jgi:hypothetical protein